MSEHSLHEPLTEFLSRYYKDEIAELAQHYPKERQSLWIDFDDLYKYNADIAEDLLDRPDIVHEQLEESVQDVELPIDPGFEGVTVRVTNLPDSASYHPGQIRKEQAGQFISVEGVLERVTSPKDRPEVVVFECQRCPQPPIEIPQDTRANEIQEPDQCPGCERNGPFAVLDREGEWSDYSKVRIESAPGSAESETGQIVGHVLNDLIDYGGESGLLGRAGEPVIVNGILHREQQTGRGEDKMLFGHHLEINSVEFKRDENTVRVEDHKEEFERLAAQDNAVDVFAESIAPNLHTTDEWDAAMEFAVAYLFGAPRIDIADGPTYRGDLHFLIISDYGLGKSDFAADIEAYSPKCISKSSTSLSSGVGLTAAAVEDEFGEGAFTIKPGLLVRANEGHLILDEIDKGPDELTDMNDALEGKQQVDVEKGGKSVTYDSKTALMALGNPENGRFDKHESISEQLGIDDSLLSRFDGIVTMEDNPDVEQDQKVAETYGRAYTEAQQAEYGDREEFDVLDREVGLDVGQAWIKYARENVHPVLSYEQFKTLEEWYATEVRQLNEKYASSGDGEDMPIPATVRDLGATVKMAIAFARCRLQDEVKEPQVERAKALGKKLVKQHWDGESFDVTKNVNTDTQNGRVKAVKDAIRDEPKDKATIAEETGISESQVETTLNNLKNKNPAPVMRTPDGEWRGL